MPVLLVRLLGIATVFGINITYSRENKIQSSVYVSYVISSSTNIQNVFSKYQAKTFSVLSVRYLYNGMTKDFSVQPEVCVLAHIFSTTESAREERIEEFLE